MSDARIPPIWRRPLIALGVAWALLLALFFRDATDMVRIWWDSSTFNHCLLMVPLIGWLVAQRWPWLRQLTPAAWAPAAVPMLGAGLLWLAGEVGGVALFRQAALVVMLMSAVLALLGPKVARGLMFPLAYMLLLVPFGEEFVPALQTLTAKMTIAMVGWAGIPAHIDGVFITTPSGFFEVAEACSGVKFLIAMVALAVLGANLCFKSWTRRILFVLFAAVTAVLANGVRAFGTIWMAEKVDIGFAASFDHIVYGWVFFGIVIALVFGAAWRFFDRPADDPPFDVAALSGTSESRSSHHATGALLAAAVLLPFGWGLVTGAREGALPAKIALAAPAGWTMGGVPGDWVPEFSGADRRTQIRLSNAQGQSVDVAVAAFARQSEGKEIVGFGQGRDPDWIWAASAPPIADGRVERVFRAGPVNREVAIWYRVGGITTSSATRAKLAGIAARLAGGDPRAVAVLVSAEERPGQPARDAIKAYLDAAGGAERLADQALELR